MQQRKRQTTQLKKWTIDLKRHFSREYTNSQQAHEERYSTSLVTREMLSNHNDIPLIPIRMARIKKLQIKSVSEDVEKTTRNPQTLLGGTENGSATVQFGISSKKS